MASSSKQPSLTSASSTMDVPRPIRSSGHLGSKISVLEAGEDITPATNTSVTTMEISKPIASITPAGSKRRFGEGQSSSCTATISATNMTIPRLITSFGPAGSKFTVREAGENILNNFCHGYPNTDVSSIIPNFFSGNITELMDPRPNLTKKEEQKRRGREINQEGEGHEKAVFDLFLKMIRRLDVSPPLLVMRSFEMDTKNAVGLKCRALLTELPELNLSSSITTAENDFVILAKDYGLIFVEVKGSTKETNVQSAEKQLSNVNSIVQSVMKTITHDKHRTIPTVKLIVVPDCADPSPAAKTPQGSYFLFSDSCDNFEQKWMEVMNELHLLKSTNPFTSTEFEELSQVLVGIWSANAVCVMDEGVRKCLLQQKAADVSYVEQLKEIDTVVDTSNLRNESHFKLQKDRLNPFTDIIRTTEQDIFRSCNDIKLCYLTPTQKHIFDSQKHALIHGVAGSGKSLLLLFKILELVNTSAFKILILAPTPHNIRMYNFLQANNVAAEMIEEFPPPSSKSDVFVMDIQNFFNVEQKTLKNYDLKKYHLFADDAQHMVFNRIGGKNNEDGQVSYFDVGEFIERTYETCVQYGTYCWFMLDVLQGYSSDGRGRYSDDVFSTQDNRKQTSTISKKKRTFKIPIIHLKHVMRNTHEVIELTNEIRKVHVKAYEVEADSLPTPQVGHNVTSRRPVLHKLQHGNEFIYKLPFIISRLREELKSISNPPYSLQMSNVAIIWGVADTSEFTFKENVEGITSFLATEFGTTPQTIKEQLTSGNRKDIILDEVDNIMSFESPVVVFICSNTYFISYYNICTRARVALTIIDVSISDTARLSNINPVLWKTDLKGNEFTFIKCT